MRVVTAMGDAVAVPVRVVCPVAAHVAVKPVIALPPFDPGVKAIETCPFVPTADVMVGAAGTVAVVVSTTVPVARPLFFGELVAVAPL